RPEPGRTYLRSPSVQAGLEDPATMKPPKFEYHAPRTVDEALALLGRYGGDAKVLAGGQSLMPLLNFRIARPAALVALNRIPSLAFIEASRGRELLGELQRTQ